MRGRRWLVLVYAVALLFVALKSLRSPAWNFDALGYVAASLSWSHADIEVVHARSYRAVADAATPKAHRAIVSSSEYRRALHANPRYFETQIPFYTNKPAYVGLIGALAWLGVSPARATYYVSIAAYLALGVLVLIWLDRRASPVVSVLVGAGFMLVPSTATFARYSTPDMLSAAWVGAGAFFLVERRNIRLAVGLFATSCLVRPDNVVFACLLLVWVALRGERECSKCTRTALLSLPVLALAWLTAHWLTGAYPWSVLVRHTFIERLYDPAQMTHGITFPEYLKALTNGVLRRQLPEPTLLPAYAVLSAVALWFTRQRRDADWAARAAGLILVCWTALFLRFLAFPMLADRLAIPIYLTLTATAIGVFFARASQAATMSPSELSP